MNHSSFIHKAKRSAQALLRFFYPPLCLHCEQLLNEELNVLCGDCLSLLEFIDPAERCPRCFSSEYSQEKRACNDCSSQQCNYLYRIAAAFNYEGPPSSLIRAMKYGNQPYLAKGAAAFMLEQFFRLNWPYPDYIVAVPLPLTRWIQRGYNQSALIAEEFGKLINRPIAKALRRTSGDFSQAGLNHEQRILLSENTFQLVKNHSLQDQSVLLIDDVFTTGSTMQRCAEKLQGAYPSSIYGLTLCRAI